MKYKLKVEFITPLDADNAESEKKAVELASKVFDLLTKEDNIALGARAIDFVFRGLMGFSNFNEIFASSRQLSTMGIKDGHIKVTTVPAIKIIGGKE